MERKKKKGTATGRLTSRDNDNDNDEGYSRLLALRRFSLCWVRW